jgi:hypothetical protein
VCDCQTLNPKPLLGKSPCVCLSITCSAPKQAPTPSAGVLNPKPETLTAQRQVREPSAVNTMFFTTTTPSRKKEVDKVIKKLRELVKHDG